MWFHGLAPQSRCFQVFCFLILLFRLETNYFEIEIVDKSSRSLGISIGLAGRRHPHDARLGKPLESSCVGD